MNKEFVKSVEKACDQAFIAHGFERPRAGTCFLRIDDSFLGWLGLNRGNYSDYLQLNPFIGIHCIPIMKLVDELEGEKYKVGSTATYAIHMGEVAPDVRQFIFTYDADLEAEAERLANEVVMHALPWMKSHANYQVLLEIIKTKVDILGGNPQWYAAGLYLNKQTEDALKFIRSRTDLFDSKDHGQYSLYYRFAEPFFRMVEKRGDYDSGSDRCGAR